MSERCDVVVLGGCIIDLISYAPRFPRPGETLAGTNFCQGFGGKGANQCVMAARLGAKTAMIAKLGCDRYGDETLQNLKENGIICDFVSSSMEGQTSTAGICVTDSGENSIVYVPGAIMKLMPDDIIAAENLIAHSKLFMCTFEARVDVLYTALSIAKKHKVRTFVNAAPSPRQEHEQFYPLIDIICVNEIEAEEATGVTVNNIESAASAAKALLKKGCKSAIVTLGPKGAVFIGNNQEHEHVAVKAVKPVDSTGAGDAFMGGLSYFLSMCPELPFIEMVNRSCKIATQSVLKLGTQSSFPYRKDFDEAFLSST